MAIIFQSLQLRQASWRSPKEILLGTAFLQAGCPSGHQTNSVKALKWKKIYLCHTSISDIKITKLQKCTVGDHFPVHIKFRDFSRYQ